MAHREVGSTVKREPGGLGHAEIWIQSLTICVHPGCMLCAYVCILGQTARESRRLTYMRKHGNFKKVRRVDPRNIEAKIQYIPVGAEIHGVRCQTNTRSSRNKAPGERNGIVLGQDLCL